MALGLWLIALRLSGFDPVSGAVHRRRRGTSCRPPSCAMRLGWSEIASGALVACLPPGMYRRWHLGAVGRRRGRRLGHAGPAGVLDHEPGAYAVDTLVGMLIVLRGHGAAAARDQPRGAGLGRRPAARAGATRPRPTQRIPIVALAFVGLFVSRYLAAYQMGHIDGCGTRSSAGRRAGRQRLRGRGDLERLEGLPDPRRRASGASPTSSTS